jgi:hypothetical protein
VWSAGLTCESQIKGFQNNRLIKNHKKNPLQIFHLFSIDGKKMLKRPIIYVILYSKRGVDDY